VKIAYLCSEYPAISHTFVLREVEALRRLGAAITTFSIRRTHPDRLLSPADRAAAQTTVAILPPSWPRLLRAHLGLALKRPSAYFSSLALALRLAPPGLRGRLWQVFYFAEATMLWDECRRRGIRHIHVHLANAAADLALIATQIGNAVEPEQPWSWSFTMHGPTEFADVGHYRLAEKLRDARFVVCISDFARSQLMALSEPEIWDRLDVVHVGIPVDQFTRSNAPPPAERRPTILYIGRLVPEKGQAVLLEAVALLAGRGHLVHVTLAGEGALRPDLERRAERLGIAPRVSFLGAVGQDRLRELYETASIFCLPSFAEGVPVVLMEAMAMGLPVVSTRITGIPELIEDGVGGLLVAPGRPDELANRLESLLSDPALCGELGTRGREAVLREFDAERSASQLYELFCERLLAPAPESSVEVAKAGA
jgi:colanic acid/amylovoran biosynthesis glycosyltransferase